MASAVCERESAIEADAVPQTTAAKLTKGEPLRTAWHMIVGPLTDAATDEQYLATTRSLLNLGPATADAEADAEFSAVLRMKQEPLVLDDAEAAVYTGLKQRRAPRVGDPLTIE